MRDSAELETNRQRFVWGLAMVVVFCLLVALLVALMRSISTVERHSLERYQQQWQQQVSYLHGMWLTQSRPEVLRLRMMDSVQVGEMSGESKFFVINMNNNGWPIANSTSECLHLWEQLLGSTLYQASTKTVVESSQGLCNFRFLDLGHIEYTAKSGRVALQWL